MALLRPQLDCTTWLVQAAHRTQLRTLHVTHLRAGREEGKAEGTPARRCFAERCPARTHDAGTFALCISAKRFRPEAVTILQYAHVLLRVEVSISNVFRSFRLLLSCRARENKAFILLEFWQKPRLPAVTCSHRPKQVSKQKNKSTCFQLVARFYLQEKGKGPFRHRC